MSDNETVISPPYPPSRGTIHHLLVCLTELRRWLQDLREWANETAASRGLRGDVLIPAMEEIPAIPDFPVFASVSLCDLNASFAALCRLRQHWDWLMAEYEADWDCRRAVAGRLNCVYLACLILKGAFVLPEQREVEEEKQHRKQLKLIKRQLKAAGVPPSALGSVAERFLWFSGGGRPQKQNKEIDDLMDKLCHGDGPGDLPADPPAADDTSPEA